MCTGIHPPHPPVVIRDGGSAAFLTRSTITPELTIRWEEGQVHPVVDVEISSATHPLWSGRQPVVDSGGRVERFRRRRSRTADLSGEGA